jgi:hypothetical protein
VSGRAEGSKFCLLSGREGGYNSWSARAQRSRNNCLSTIIAAAILASQGHESRGGHHLVEVLNVAVTLLKRLDFAVVINFAVLMSDFNPVVNSTFGYGGREWLAAVLSQPGYKLQQQLRSSTAAVSSACAVTGYEGLLPGHQCFRSWISLVQGICDISGEERLLPVDDFK